MAVCVYTLILAGILILHNFPGNNTHKLPPGIIITSCEYEWCHPQNSNWMIMSWSGIGNKFSYPHQSHDDY